MGCWRRGKTFGRSIKMRKSKRNENKWGVTGSKNWKADRSSKK